MKLCNNRLRKREVLTFFFLPISWSVCSVFSLYVRLVLCTNYIFLSEKINKLFSLKSNEPFIFLCFTRLMIWCIYPRRLQYQVEGDSLLLQIYIQVLQMQNAADSAPNLTLLHQVLLRSELVNKKKKRTMQIEKRWKQRSWDVRRIKLGRRELGTSKQSNNLSSDCPDFFYPCPPKPFNFFTVWVSRTMRARKAF